MQTTDSLREQAVARHRQGALAEAERLYRAVLEAAPHDFTARHLLGVAQAQGGRMAAALAELDAALAIRPDDAEALLNRGNVLRALDRHEEALAAFDAALVARPDFAQGWNNRGVMLKALGRFEDALDSLDRALALDGAYAEALTNRGSVLQDLRRPGEALAVYDRVLAAQPGNAAAHNNRGSALLDLRRPAEALDAFDRALAIRPGDADTLGNRGNALQALKRLDEALAAHDRALSIRPDHAAGWNNRGSVLQDMKRYAAALESFDRALALDPSQEQAFGGTAMAALNLCDFDRADEIGAQMEERIRAGAAIPPWTLLGYRDDPQLQRLCARNALARRFGPSTPWQGPGYRHDRIRIAYVSSDFGQHPVAQQIAQLIEDHDRARVWVMGLATSPDDGSALRARLARGFDSFHDASRMSPAAAAALLREAEVDILVDLNGHTSGDNFDLLHLRPAPVQASWLGYAGTSAADFVDHVIADAVVAPRDSDFSEQVARLPHSFFVSDTTRPIGPMHASRDVGRAEAGLPPEGFVFCCFNNNWKITRPVFESWMRLLAALPGSVLWLKKSTGEAADNLRMTARQHGIGRERLVFADNAPADLHLARHALADLFLDTAPYNAHATACDALWAGLPVLTCAGLGYAARVAASLLTALEMDELVTHTPAEYEALALALARDPARLKALRDRLADKRRTAPLFDTPRFARDLEAAYAAMLDR